MSSYYEPTAGSYILNRVFHFPTDGGSALAIAVSAANASSILSIYSILVNTAVGQIWAIIVIIGVYAILRRPAESRSHNEVVASVGVLNAKRPFDVGALIFNYLWRLKGKSPWSMLLWLFVSIFALIASAGVPALIVRTMVLGHGAPVNPNSIYVPLSTLVTHETAFLLNAIAVPSALRAAGSVQSTDLSMYDNKVRIDNPVKLSGRPDIGDGEYVSQHGYRYEVTAKDFGLQRYTGLTLHVEGLCTTEYGWHSDSSTTDGKESYCLWSNCSMPFTVSVHDSPIPVAVFKTKFSSTTGNPERLNHSFAMIVSSAEHTSYSEGKNPFYLTGSNYTENDSNHVYRVKKGRPILSCWQSDTWSYRNQHFAVKGLSSIITDFPEALEAILVNYLSLPMITELGVRLGQSTLLSARSSLGNNFYAAGANIHADLTHLVLASYVATKNILTDTALLKSDNTTDMGIPNLLDDEQQKDVAIFVLYSKDISALSLAVLISVPFVVAFMFVIAYIVTSHSWFPWYVVQGYRATALYSLLDEKLSGAERPSDDDANKEKGHGHRPWKPNTITRFEEPKASGRQASIVQGADGQRTLIVTERAEPPESRQRACERSETTTLLEPANEKPGGMTV